MSCSRNFAATLEGDFVIFYLVEPGFWEGYLKVGFVTKGYNDTKPFARFQMRRDNFSYKYIVEYFNINQRAIAIPLDSPQDAISVIDVSIKLGVKFTGPK